MAISLSKGQKVDLTKSNPGLTNITVGVGWDTNKYDGGKDFDLDSSIFLLNAAGVCADEKDFVFFNNLEGGNGSVVHTGDNLTGEGDGDDEQVKFPFRMYQLQLKELHSQLQFMTQNNAARNSVKFQTAMYESSTMQTVKS